MCHKTKQNQILHVNFKENIFFYLKRQQKKTNQPTIANKKIDDLKYETILNNSKYDCQELQF